jgi:hypothetical protein
MCGADVCFTRVSSALRTSSTVFLEVWELGIGWGRRRGWSAGAVTWDCGGRVISQVVPQAKRRPLVKLFDDKNGVFFQYSVGKKFKDVNDAWAMATTMAEDRTCHSGVGFV